jgi:hypothetical protein
MIPNNQQILIFTAYFNLKMELDDLLLTKKELPILYGNCFIIPIHPKLLSDGISIDPKIANRVFPQVAAEWYDDLKEYVGNLGEGETKTWIKTVFLKETPKITESYGHQVIKPGVWEDNVWTKENGLAHCLSIDRNAGGSLYIMEHPELIMLPYVNFTPKKFKEFDTGEMDQDNAVTSHMYGQHNIDHYPGALFLRNWAILYLNEVFKQIF